MTDSDRTHGMRGASDPVQLFSGTSETRHLSKPCHSQQYHPISGFSSIMRAPFRQGEARSVWNQIEPRITETLVAMALEHLGMNAAEDTTQYCNGGCATLYGNSE